MRSEKWILMMLVFASVRCASADDSWTQKDLELRVRSDLFLATRNAGQSASLTCVPLPERETSPTLDGALNDPIWSEATSIPLPYVRAAGEGRIVAEARLLAFVQGDRLFLGLRLPSTRVSGRILSWKGPHEQESHAMLVSKDGRTAIECDGDADSVLQSTTARCDTETIVELELDRPEREVTLFLRGGTHDDRPLNNIEVRLVPSDTAWRLSRVDDLKGRCGWQLSVIAPGTPPVDVVGEQYVHQAAGLSTGWKSASLTPSSNERQTTFSFHAPPAVGTTLLRVTGQANPTAELENGWRRLDLSERRQPSDFASPDFDDREWAPAVLPDRDDLSYSVERPWMHYRVRFTMPETWQGETRDLLIQKIDDHGWVYLNGEFVGEHHRYDIPFRADVTNALHRGANVLAVLVKNDGNTPGGLVGRVAIEEPSCGPFSVTVTSYVPDTERLLEQVKAAAAGPDVRVGSSDQRQLEEIERRIADLKSRLGNSQRRVDWDNRYRRLHRLGRRIALESPLVDFEKLVFVKRKNFGGWDGFFGYTSYLKPPPASLCLLESLRSGGPIRTLLHTDRGCVRDPDVDFDGQCIVFAYAEDDNDSYHLYEMRSDGTGLRQLTTSPPFKGPEPPSRGPGFHDVEPCYTPSGDIVFTSTRYVRYVDCVDVEPVTTLFVMDGNGEKMRGISANHVHDWHPAVLNDGRIVYTRWEYTDRSQMWPHKLFVKNPDGSATAALYGSNSWWPVSMLHARAVPGSSRILCTLTGHHSGTDQTGEIGLIDRSRGTEEAGGVVALFPPRPIEPIYRDDPRPGPDSYYTEPYPLSERWFLVSARPPGAERFGIYLANFSGLKVLVYEDDKLDCLSVMPLAERWSPPVIPSQVDYASTEATIVMADIYRGAGLAGIPRGTVKALRVIDFDVRDTPGTGGLRQENGPSGGHSCPVTALGGSWHVKRILGTVPVHPDGSAAFRIPAERRVFFQPLDERGMALQTMRSWVEAMPGEQISCVGCHERSAEPPPRRSIMALQQEPVAVRPWYGPPRSFSFAREVQPVLDRYCISCHNEKDPAGLDLRGDRTNWFSLAYENLRPYVNPIGPQGSAEIPKPKSQGAVASRLIAMLQSGHEGVHLDDESMDRIVTWIDLNVPYYDNTAITRPSHVALSNEVTGSGRAVVANAKPLWNALGNRCQACHPGGFRIDPAAAPCQVPELPETLVTPILNLTHPEQSRILTAPLAQSAGGFQRCGQTVFADRQDAVYRAALRVIQGWHEELVTRPREDMPGFVPCDAYHQTQAKREAWLRLERQARNELAQ
jgi:hypothetical protein